MLASNWNTLINSYADNTVISGQVLKIVPGGVIVDVCGHEGFLPKSQLPLDFNPDSESEVEVDFQILKVNAITDNIVVSRKEIIKRQKDDAYINGIKSLTVGEIYDGVVKRVVSYGVFVTLTDCVDGLVPSKELSWKYFNNIKDVVAVNDVIKVKVLDVDVESRRVSLSHKACTPSPWESIKNLTVGEIYDGVVRLVVPHGVFVTLVDGVDGFVHASELSWQNINNIKDVIAVNDVIKVKVLDVDVESRRVSLSHKACSPSPWESIDTNVYQINSELNVSVAKIMGQYLIVNFENGCQGILHKSEISWEDKDIRLHSEFKVGDNLHVVITFIDISQHKISVSIKRLTKKPSNSIQYIKPGFHVYCKVFQETEEGFELKTSRGQNVFLSRSEISWLKRFDVSDYIPENKSFEVLIYANGDANRPNIGSIRRMSRDPMTAYSPNTVHKGIVSGETYKIYFVNFKDGLTGIILKDTLKGRRLTSGQVVNTTVVESDKESRRIVLELNVESEFTGKDIMSLLNLRPSREVGILKKLLVDAIKNNEIDTSYAAGMAFIKEKAKDVLQ